MATVLALLQLVGLVGEDAPTPFESRLDKSRFDDHVQFFDAIKLSANGTHKKRSVE